MARSNGKRSHIVWTDAHGTSSSPRPAGSGRRNWSPTSRGQNRSATASEATTTRPVTASTRDHGVVKGFVTGHPRAA